MAVHLCGWQMQRLVDRLGAVVPAVQAFLARLALMAAELQQRALVAEPLLQQRALVALQAQTVVLSPGWHDCQPLMELPLTVWKLHM